MQMRIRALPDSHGHSPPPTRIRTQVLNYQEGAANKEAPAEAPEPRKDNKEEVRVLIVEDHWANRRLLEAMLKKQRARLLKRPRETSAARICCGCVSERL